MTSAARLSLHVPEPTVRPGGMPDFSHVGIAEAGEVPRPPIDVSPSDIRNFAYTMIRALDDQGEAVGDWRGALTVDDLRKGLRDMMLTRAFDARMLLSQRQGKTSFYITCLGEEAIATAHRKALADGDMCFPTYRQQGLLIAQGWPIVDMMCEIFSNEKDHLKGRQLPGLYSFKKAGFFTVSGNLGTQYPQAVGWAMASAISGDTRIASGWIGEGSTAESDFHAALVFASVYRPPVILNVVNNQWAISSYQGIAGGESARFAARAHGFGIPSLRVDGNDYLAVHAVSVWAARKGARQSGPDFNRMGDLSRRRAFDLGRSVEISPQGRMVSLAVGRSGRAAEGSPHPHRRMERRAPSANAGRGRRGNSRRRQAGRKPRHAA